MRRAAVAVLLLALAGCGATTQRATVTGHGSCRERGSGLFVMADRRCTPGVWVDDGAGVCSEGYNPRPAESVTEPLKRDAMARYGVPWSRRGSYELDHLYPRWLGGATVAANLWPEPDYPPAGREPFVWNPKDRLEEALYRDVCWRHSLTVGQARAAFERGWVAAYRRYVG